MNVRKIPAELHDEARRLGKDAEELAREEEILREGRRQSLETTRLPDDKRPPDPEWVESEMGTEAGRLRERERRERLARGLEGLALCLEDHLTREALPGLGDTFLRDCAAEDGEAS